MANRLFSGLFFCFCKRGGLLKALEEKILKEGTVLPGDILKVGSFLNHQLDSGFMMEMGREIARLFEQDGVTKILTVEASGIALALAAGVALQVPVVFAKKNKTANLSGGVCQTVIHSYTHGVDYHVVVEKQYLHPEDTVLIVDDFLANGKAIEGLLELVKQAGAKTAGAACAIEKGFQHGGDKLRQQGLKVESLAIIESMSDNGLTFRTQPCM